VLTFRGSVDVRGPISWERVVGMDCELDIWIHRFQTVGIDTKIISV
jgi:hypothetical protein